MSLDKNQEAQLNSLVNPLTASLSQLASNLLSNKISIKFDGVVEAMTSAKTIDISQEMVIVHANLTGTKLNLLFTSNDAAIIAQLMSGSQEATAEFTGAAKDAFVSAMSQILSQGLAGNDKLKLDSDSLEATILDPVDPASLELGELGNQQKLAMAFSIIGEAGLSMNTQVEVASSLVNFVFGTTQRAIAEKQNQTVGDVFGADFSEIVDSHNPAEVDEKKNLNLLMDIKLGLIVELGRSEMHLKEILKLTKGSIIELDRLSGEPVDLFANNKLIARGEVVVIDDNFGLRITQLAGLNNQSELSLLTGEID